MLLVQEQAVEETLDGEESTQGKPVSLNIKEVAESRSTYIS